MAMTEAREKQFTHITAARAGVKAWAERDAVPLVHIDWVVPFVETDFGLFVWLFYATDLDVARCESDGTTERVRAEFLAALEAGGYPGEWLAEVEFRVDSAENVDRNYAGSYFHRLR